MLFTVQFGLSCPRLAQLLLPVLLYCAVHAEHVAERSQQSGRQAFDSLGVQLRVDCHEPVEDLLNKHLQLRLQVDLDFAAANVAVLGALVGLGQRMLPD